MPWPFPEAVGAKHQILEPVGVAAIDTSSHDSTTRMFETDAKGKALVMDINQDAITDRLDRLEADLPRIPSKSLRLTRATTRRVNEVTSTVIERAGEFARPVAKSAVTATKTVVGQARSATDRSIASVRKGSNETVGQLNAQASRAAGTLRSEVEDLLDDATATVAPESRNPASLDDLDKAELYQRAQALDIDGRSTMSKAELVEALRDV